MPGVARIVLKVCPALVMVAVVAGCATVRTPPVEQRLAAVQKPAPGSYYLDDGPPAVTPQDIQNIPDARPKREPLRASAMKPYTALGMRFVPMTRLEVYRATGHASWYGKRYHGQLTASGEPYDMLAMTAAHPTLPIPSYARVTNLANQRSVIVRVNDRGPFHVGRLIDLSYAAASKLDLVRIGGGEVEVQLIIPDEHAVAAQPDEHRLQLGAYQSRENAQAALTRIQGSAAWLADRLYLKQENNLHRVFAGPFVSRDEAQSAADRIEHSLSLRPVLQTSQSSEP